MDNLDGPNAVPLSTNLATPGPRPDPGLWVSPEVQLELLVGVSETQRDPPMEVLLPLTGQGGLFSPRGEIIEHILGTCRLMQCSRWPDPEVKCPGSKWGLPPPNPSCLGGLALLATSPAPASSGLAPASVGLIPSWFCRRPTAALGVF